MGVSNTGILAPSLDRPQEASDARYGNKHRDSLENAHDGETLDSSETNIWENPVAITGWAEYAGSRSSLKDYGERNEAGPPET